MTAARLPTAFWVLWTGFLVNRLGLLTPAFLTLYLTGQHVTSAGEAGAAIGVYGTGALCGGLLGGAVADRLGPRRTLFCSQALAAGGGLALMLVRQPYLVIVLALVVGTLNGVGRSAGYGLVSVLTPEERWSAAYGRLYWATSLGTTVTAPLAGLMLQIWPPALFLPGVVGSAAYAGAVLALPEAPRRLGGPVAVVTDLARPFRSRCVGPFLLLITVLSALYAQRHSAMPLDMRAHGLGYGHIGLLLALGAVLIVVVQPVAGRVIGRLPPRSAFALSALLIGVGFWTNLLAGGPAGYVLPIVLWTFGEILVVPLALTFVAAHAPSGLAATFQGAYGFVWTLGFTVGAPAGTLLLAGLGAAPLWWGSLAVGAVVAFGLFHLAPRCGFLGPPGGSRPSATPAGRHRIVMHQ